MEAAGANVPFQQLYIWMDNEYFCLWRKNMFTELFLKFLKKSGFAL